MASIGAKNRFIPGKAPPKPVRTGLQTKTGTPADPAVAALANSNAAIDAKKQENT